MDMISHEINETINYGFAVWYFYKSGWYNIPCPKAGLTLPKELDKNLNGIYINKYIFSVCGGCCFCQNSNKKSPLLNNRTPVDGVACSI